MSGYRNKYKKYTYTVKHSCGHEDEHVIGGYTEDYRCEVAKELEKEICPECKRREWEKKREEKYKRCKEIVGEMEEQLPQLVGTKKQVKWAESIRNRLMVECVSKDIDVSPFLLTDSAKFFIDSRYSMCEAVPRSILIDNLEKKIDDSDYIKLEGEYVEAPGIRRRLVAKLEAGVFFSKNEEETEDLKKAIHILKNVEKDERKIVGLDGYNTGYIVDSLLGRK